MLEILRKSLLVSFVGLFCCYQTVYAEKRIDIKSQSEFDGLSGLIKSYLKGIPQGRTETITVHFSEGVYRFNQHLVFVNISHPNVSLHFTANSREEVHFIGAGNEYVPSEAKREIVSDTHYFVPLKGSYCRGEVFVDQNFNIVPVSDSGDLLYAKINRAASRREKISRAVNGKYPVDYARFKLPDELSFLKNKDSVFFKNKLICFKHWYAQIYGSIAKTDNEYIYFYHSSGKMLDALAAAPEWDSWKGFPLFYITNVTNQKNEPEADKILVTDGGIYVPKRVTKLYECKRQLMAGFWDVYLKEVKFSNLYFSGAANFDYETYSKEDQEQKTNLTNDGLSNYRSALMGFTNVDHVVFQDCEFRNIGSSFAVSIAKSDTYKGDGGFTFHNNKASDIGGQVVQSYAKNTKITHNRIHRTGLFSTGRPDPILVTSSSYEVANNTISDFTGNGMTIGSNICSVLMDQYPISGVVKENELYLTPEYLSHLERYTLEDTHAIYFVNYQTNSSCQDNIIHDFEGYKFTNGTGRCNNKAIAIDCGGYNVNVMRNLVYNVADLAFIGEYHNSHHAKSTTNIQLKNNVFFAPYRFIGNPSFPTSSGASGNYMAIDIKGKNNGLLAGLQQLKQNIQKGDDFTDENAEVKGELCYVSKDIDFLNLSEFVRKRLKDPSDSPSIPDPSKPDPSKPDPTKPDPSDPNPNADISSDTDHIWSDGKLICIRSFGKQIVHVYTFSGSLVRTMDVNIGETFIPATSGFYIVRLGNLARKVYVE